MRQEEPRLLLFSGLRIPMCSNHFISFLDLLFPYRVRISKTSREMVAGV